MSKLLVKDYTTDEVQQTYEMTGVKKIIKTLCMSCIDLEGKKDYQPEDIIWVIELTNGTSLTFKQNEFNIDIKEEE